MPRPLPSQSPEQLEELLYKEGYTSLTHLALVNGLPPPNVIHFFGSNQLKVLKLLKKIAEATDSTIEDIYSILTMPDTTVRRERFLEKLALSGFSSLNQLAKKIGISSGTLSYLLNEQNISQRYQLSRGIAMSLGLDLDQLTELFKSRLN